jgi:hypothetical protein
MLLKLRLSVDSIPSALTILHLLSSACKRIAIRQAQGPRTCRELPSCQPWRLAVNVRCRANVGMAHEKVIFTRPQLISWPVNALKIAVVCPRNLVFAQSSACEVESA